MEASKASLTLLRALEQRVSECELHSSPWELVQTGTLTRDVAWGLKGCVPFSQTPRGN